MLNFQENEASDENQTLNTPFNGIGNGERPNPMSKKKVLDTYGKVRNMFKSVEGILDMFAGMFNSVFSSDKKR